MVAQVLVAVGDHGAPTVPPAAAHDVHLGRGESVRGAHHGADVVVVAEVLDRDMQRVAPGIDIGDHGLATPVAVGVNNVAPITVAQQLRVVARVIGPWPHPRSDADRLTPLSGASCVANSVTTLLRSHDSSLSWST